MPWNWNDWQRAVEAQARDAMRGADAAHDVAHLRRVVANAQALALEEQAELAVVLPAAWLHDCIHVPKDSPQRAEASRLAADEAVRRLAVIGYPECHLDGVAHAVAAHSYSAGLQPRTLEARVVQDADRLDALGAVGIARCFQVSGALGGALHHPDQPFPQGRELDDRRYAIDHFYAKLLRLPDTMQTAAGRREAHRRAAFMQGYLAELAREFGLTL